MNLLTALGITELSIVDRPANPLSKIAIFKSADNLPHRSIITKAKRGYNPATATEDEMADQFDNEPASFEEGVERLRREGRSRVAAMSYARKKWPRLFADYQSGATVKVATPVTKSADVTKFEQIVDRVRARDNVSKVEAMRRARQQYPIEFAAFQSA